MPILQTLQIFLFVSLIPSYVVINAVALIHKVGIVRKLALFKDGTGINNEWQFRYKLFLKLKDFLLKIT